MKHASISVFVPHLACPNDCVFCNQKRIAGTEKPIADIDGFLAAACEDLSDRFDEVDIAFFGGSFTLKNPKCVGIFLPPREQGKNTKK